MRRQHRVEAQRIAAALSQVPRGRPILIGGDCNAPGGDGALREWSPLLRDAFYIGGRGWGATVLNSFPVMRFDQLWCSSGIGTTAIYSFPSDHSDHRLVVGDFTL
jgi:endonuclease/exonuclease/phosphatase (EEP) superfamily protein YafD